MKEVVIYTGASCKGNPGIGAWSAVLQYGEHVKEISGTENQTTNNRMALTALISALRQLREPCVVHLWCSSAYVVDSLEKGRAKAWKERGWVKADKKKASNPELWETLLLLTEKHEMVYHHGDGFDADLREKASTLAISAYLGS